MKPYVFYIFILETKVGSAGGFQPGDNPVYELGNTAVDVSSRPSQTSLAHYMNFYPDRERADSMLERELENPIYGDDQEASDTYAGPFEHQTQSFVPAYDTGVDYEVPCDSISHNTHGAAQK